MNQRRFAARTLLIGLFGGTIAFAGMGTSCVHRSDRAVYLVPEEDTARDQMAVAEQQLLQARGVVDRGQRRNEILKTIEAYRAVESRFPDDEIYTPAAALLIGDLYRQELEDHNKAIEQYKHALQQYPNHDDVRIEALFGTALSYNETNRLRESKVYFKQLLDEYSDTRDPRFRDRVERARILYRQVSILEE